MEQGKGYFCFVSFANFLTTEEVVSWTLVAQNQQVLKHSCLSCLSKFLNIVVRGGEAVKTTKLLKKMLIVVIYT